MSGSPLIQAIQERLRGAGYSDLSTPFKLAGVEFAFTGAMRGCDGRALDLVLLVEHREGMVRARRAAGRDQRAAEQQCRQLPSHDASPLIDPKAGRTQQAD